MAGCKIFRVGIVCFITYFFHIYGYTNTIDLGEIVVTPSKVGEEKMISPYKIDVISSDEIDDLAPEEISELLDSVSGVDMLEYGTFGATRSIHIRGASSSQVLTLIDGRPINNPRDGVTDFNSIPLSYIDRIEVLKGPASNIYGANAVGGVVNIITKKPPEGAHFELLTEFGSFLTKRASFMHTNKVDKFDYLISYDYLISEGHRDNSAYLSHNINTKLGYDFGENNRLSFSTGFYNSEAGSPGTINYVDIDDKLDTYKRYFDLTYQGKLTDSLDVFLKVFHNYDRIEFTETPYPLDRDTHQMKVYGYDNQISWNLSSAIRLNTGFSYQQHRLNSSASGKHAYNFKGVFIGMDFILNDKGVIKLSSRWDDYSNFGDKISPSASFSIWINKYIKLHSLAAKSFRAPTFNDLYWPKEDWGAWGGVEGNPNLGPEEAISYEAGIKLYVKDIIESDITLFKNSFEDLIEWVMDSSLWWRPENIGSATIKGLEWDTWWYYQDVLKVNFNYTYLEPKNTETKKWLTYRPHHLYKVKFIYSPIKKLDLGLNLIYKTKRFTDANNTKILKPYLLVNANFVYKLTENINLLGKINNLLDKQYEESSGYPLPGLSFYGGIKITF